VVGAIVSRATLLLQIRKLRIIVRMRTSRLLDVLLSRTKQQILAATLLQPTRQWYLVELARHLGVRPSSVQRELKLLSDAGILKRHQNGNRVYFAADTACPIFPELAQIMCTSSFTGQDTCRLYLRLDRCIF
jgi:DNA-binding transcriptional ArsR family regulator